MLYLIQFKQAVEFRVIHALLADLLSYFLPIHANAHVGAVALGYGDCSSKRISSAIEKSFGRTVYQQRCSVDISLLPKKWQTCGLSLPLRGTNRTCIFPPALLTVQFSRPGVVRMDERKLASKGEPTLVLGMGHI